VYSETPPPPALRRLVRCRWASVEAGPKRIVPDGCADLVAGGGEVFVAGPDTTAWMSVFPPGTAFRGLRFRPGAAAAALGVGADELRDSRVPLSRLWNRRGEILADEILSGGDLALALPGQAAADPVVERLLARLEAEPRRNGLPSAGPHFPAAPSGREPPDDEQPGARSERQARRRFVVAVGYGPAVYRRVLRFQRAVALAPRAPPLADLAAAAGYADQAHLARECRALAGLPPSAYFG
jgi:hypothetical protein